LKKGGTRVPDAARREVTRRRAGIHLGFTANSVTNRAPDEAKLVPGFTRKYDVDQLVHIEAFDSILEARAREHALKR
jgi:putative endonuclease